MVSLHEKWTVAFDIDNYALIISFAFDSAKLKHLG
jgi:hypothetical protein